MQVTFRLTASDLANIRFAYSPLIELSMSYQSLQGTKHENDHPAWGDEARRTLYGIELPYLAAAVPPTGYVADFVTPTPTVPIADIEAEIVRMRATPTETIRRNILCAMEYGGESPTRQHFLMYPHEAMECLIEEVRLYWKRALQRHWTRLQSSLENDILYRARQEALHGVEAMFSDLMPEIQYRDHTLHIDKPSHVGKKSDEQSLDGRGLYLVPAIFRNGISWQVAPEWSPQVIYRARGGGLWYTQSLPNPEKELELTLGAPRANILLALREPTSTTDLGRALHMSAGAVSQHLARLRRAKLVESHRSGHKVYYRLTERGIKLLRLFED